MIIFLEGGGNTVTLFLKKACLHDLCVSDHKPVDLLNI